MQLKVISGGQTGVDRAALDAALDAGLDCGGFVPLGRRAEDGPIAPRYPVEECSSPDYPVRTELNVREAGGTLILTLGKPDGGTALTVRLCRKLKKPCLVLDLARVPEARAAAEAAAFAAPLKVLNVAGPRESRSPGIHERAYALLLEVFRR